MGAVLQFPSNARRIKDAASEVSKLCGYYGYGLTTTQQCQRMAARLAEDDDSLPAVQIAHRVVKPPAWPLSSDLPPGAA